jgi:hypothetical protein
LSISDFSSEDSLKMSIRYGVACPREIDHSPNLQRSLIQAYPNVKKGLKPTSALLHIRLPGDSLRIVKSKARVSFSMRAINIPIPENQPVITSQIDDKTFSK